MRGKEQDGRGHVRELTGVVAKLHVNLASLAELALRFGQSGEWLDQGMQSS
jgi:hypothetical protein